MENTWHGEIAIQSGHDLRDVSLSSDDRHCIPPKSSLRFLAIVETSRIPFHITVGRPLWISTGNEKTAQWFSSILLNDPEQPADSQRWWQSARSDSPLGILVSVDDKLESAGPLSRPRVSELLFFASRTASTSWERPPTPPESSPLRESPNDVYPQSVEVFALPLSSELLFKGATESTPPPSPGSEVGHEATFLPSRANEQASRPPLKKRRNINDAFDEAEERRHKARRRGGEGVSAAAAAAVQLKSEESITSLKHRRSISSTQVPIQNRQLSRSSSTASMRPISMREPSVQPGTARPSGLSQSQSAPIIPQFPEIESLEQKNRVFINKMVVNGMRMKGLRQSKPWRLRANSRAESPAPRNTEEAKPDSKNDEEYKQLYNQVCKGAYFVFRRHIATYVLEGHIEALDEAINRLLELYMLDPLSIGKDEAMAEDDVTPSGRIPFGSSAGRVQGQANPFVQAAFEDGKSRTDTPLLQNWS